MAPRRVKLGERRDLMGRERVYEAAEFLECEEAEGSKVRRRRLFYDEIVLVTLHQQIGGTGLITAAILIGLGALAALVTAGIAGARAGGLTLLVLAPPLLAFLIMRVAIQEEIVTVFGLRGRARMAFWLRRARARAVYDGIVARVTQARMGVRS
jgi:hypothetical protein